ncbi:hypothetical protein GDO86_003088 [Hymenochirus boettgeri]|uniref:Calponin-homology (CH) domain-containing protein n=1 Tax=Hymenochirus boettgeri TaxID=247094 RepID=A0A8T2JZI4_9PIPI|nr:hypothetical protein GDO86_003088 [Hymenochirus boettgeri]
MDPGLELSGWQDSGYKAEDGAVREEMNSFKRGVERQLEDVLKLVAPLSRSVANLQSENRRLREQVDTLSRQVELLSRAAGLDGEGPARYSSHALLPLSGKSQSVVPEAENDVDNTYTMSSPVVENGHQHLSDKEKGPQDASSFVPVSHTQSHSSTPDVRVAHMPVTAVTKVAAEAPPSTANINRQYGQEPKSPTEVSLKHSNTQSAAVRTWNASVVRTMGVSSNSEKTVSATKTTMSYNATSSTVSSERGKGESKVKLKRSQSFGVASASSIKQILLEWCRSKTIGYKKIDLQNFSSSWNDGMAFCALVHSFFPEAFDYDALEPSNLKHNFEQAFSTAEKLANCDRLIEVEDMLMMGRKPDPMCVFTYVQSLYNHLRRFE